MCVAFSGYLCKRSSRGADERLHVPVSGLSQLAGEIFICGQTRSYHSGTGNAHESQVELTFLFWVISVWVFSSHVVHYLPLIPCCAWYKRKCMFCAYVRMLLLALS